jgi:tetratricopeptide (TPR) repeat protein
VAHTLIAVFRVICRVQEAFASGPRRQKLRDFRAKMDFVNRERDAVLKQIENQDGADLFDALDKFAERIGDEGDRTEYAETRAHIQAMRQESDALQQIVRGAGENKACAAEALREYLRTHPDSHFGHSYLGGVLQQVGDLDGSLVAYQEAERLAKADSASAVSARLQTGRVLQQKGDLPAAVATFRRIIEETPPGSTGESVLCVVYLQLGDALRDSGDQPNARRAWKLAAHWDTTKTVTDQVRERLG